MLTMRFMFSYDIAKLERARRLKGWSKAEVARRAGITPPALTAIWKGEHKSAETLKLLAEVLGLQVVDILIEDRQQPQDQPAA